MGIVIECGRVDWKTLQSILDAMTAIDLAQWRAAGGLPPLRRLGIRYKREPRGQERWLTSTQIRRKRRGAPIDCEDLACDTAAAIIFRTGIKARAVWRRSSVGAHIVVRMPSGKILDPSRALGMGS